MGGRAPEPPQHFARSSKRPTRESERDTHRGTIGKHVSWTSRMAISSRFLPSVGAFYNRTGIVRALATSISLRLLFHPRRWTPLD